MKSKDSLACDTMRPRSFAANVVLFSGAPTCRACPWTSGSPGCGLVCRERWRSGKSAASRCVPSASSPAWVCAEPRGSPWEQAACSPPPRIWSPAQRQEDMDESKVSSRKLHWVNLSCDQKPRAHVSVGEVPVRSLPVRHHLPHDHAVAPHVTGGGELPVGDGLRGRPADRDLSALPDTKRSSTGSGSSAVYFLHMNDAAGGSLHRRVHSGGGSQVQKARGRKWCINSTFLDSTDADVSSYRHRLTWHLRLCLLCVWLYYFNWRYGFSFLNWKQHNKCWVV